MITYSNRPETHHLDVFKRTSMECRAPGGFKAVGACGPCHWTPSVGHLAGADARSSIQLLGPGSDENPETREPWKTNSLHLKNMFFGDMLEDVFLWWFFPFENDLIQSGDSLVLGWNYIAQSCQDQTRQTYGDFVCPCLVVTDMAPPPVRSKMCTPTSHPHKLTGW